MKIAFAFFAAPIAFFGALIGMSSRSVGVEGAEIRVVPVVGAPEANTINLKIAVPKEKEVVPSNPIWIQFRIDGFALGSDSSQFLRASQIAQSDMGQTIHVVIDNNPYFAVNEPAINPFNETGWYYDTSYRFEMPYALKPGRHTIRMFPARSFGESLKGDGTFAVQTFYVGNSNDAMDVNLSQPYLTYNEPSDQMSLSISQPILLDFLIANCDLSQDGYNVRLSIDGKFIKAITSWQPYYIYGLTEGKHKVRLELMNRKSKVPGSFNDVERTIVIQES